jgi:hypothetical protein
MSADIVPFPIARRSAFIQKQADHATCLRPDAAGRYLEYQMQVQRDAMRRRGVPEDLVARELKCMERAVHQELLRASLSTGAT